MALVLISLALIAFAANSVLCRMALGAETIDPGSFTAVRLISGALMLWAIVSCRTLGKPTSSNTTKAHQPDWFSHGALALFVYAVCFSYAYVELNTATGALVLFAMVQITLVTLGLTAGQRLNGLETLGLLIAIGGFAYLMLPSATRPEPAATLLMAAAGVAWGIYTWLGRSTTHPLGSTARNFRLSTPYALITLAAAMGLDQLHLSTSGFVLAILSGTLASAVGYAIWYSVLPTLSAAQAGILQLLVPVIAALGGVVFVGEPLTLHLVTAGLVILAGIGTLFWGRYRSIQL